MRDWIAFYLWEAAASDPEVTKHDDVASAGPKLGAKAKANLHNPGR